MFAKSSNGPSTTRVRYNSAQEYTPINWPLYHEAWSSQPVYPTVVSGYPIARNYEDDNYSIESITSEDTNAYFKNCKHEVRIRSMAAVGEHRDLKLYTSHTPLNYYIVNRYPSPVHALQSQLPGMVSESSVNQMPALVLNDLEGALGRAYKDMLPRIEDLTGGTNLINFCLELKDVKKMFSLWRSSYGVLKNLSAGILNVSYAWIPFINDLKDMHRGLSSLSKYLDRWNRDAKAGVIYTRHADITQQVWTDGSQDLSGSAAGGTTGDSYVLTNIYHRSYSEEVRVIAHLAFKPRVVPDTGLRRLAAYFDAIGIGDPLSIVWEAIPFSFLADYFISVGRFLSQFDHDFFLTPVSIVDFGYSVKSSQTYRYAYERSYVSPYRSPVGFIQPESYYIVRKYDRMRLCPPPISGEQAEDVDLGLLEVHQPSLRQMFLMVNLFNVLRR